MTIQSILDKRSLGSRCERLLALEHRVLEQQIELTPELVKLIEKANPCFAGRQAQSSRPGELLCQNTFDVGTFTGVDKAASRRHGCGVVGWNSFSWVVESGQAERDGRHHASAQS
jgi:hypothetical protein